MTRPVLLTPLAEADIARARDWYDAQRRGLGNRFVARVDQAIGLIAENPLLYAPVIKDVRRADLKRFPYGIWFRVDPDGTVVVACLHHRRDPRLVTGRAPGLLPKR